MLSLHILKNVQLLISFLVFLTQKPLTIKRSRRRNGGPMGSSIPNHDAKKQKRQTTKRQKTKQKKNPRADCIKHSQSKYNIENNNIYDALTILTHDACSNVVRKVQLYCKNYEIGLSIEIISKTQNFENPLSKIPTN